MAVSTVVASALYCMAAAAVVAEFRVPAIREGPRARHGQDGALF